jgi:hypothetical protein
MKVSDLPDWPPSIFGIVGPPSTVPTHPDKVAIKSVGLVTNERVEAIGTFQDRDVRFNVQVPDKIIGEKVATILRDNIGQILLSVGPSFPHPMDLSIDVRSGQVTVRSPGKDGKEEVKSEHLDLTPDLVNGLILSIATNLRPDTPETKVPMVVAMPKPRLVKVAISPQGKEPFSLAGSPRKAMRFTLKIELGGVAGVIAPLIGKTPPEIQIWIIGGMAPAFVKEEGPLYEGGPVWTIQLTSPVWPDLPRSGS